jgi:hypothetical protein
MKKIFSFCAIILLSQAVQAQRPTEGNNSSVEVALNLGENNGLTISAPLLRYRYFLNPNIALRLELAVNNQSEDVAGFESTFSSWVAAPAFEYHFSGNEKLDPYAFAGIGFGESSSEFSNPAGQPIKSESSIFFYSVGLGMDYYVFDRVYLGTEFGFTAVTFTTPVDGQTKDDRSSQSGFDATAGIRLGWRF